MKSLLLRREQRQVMGLAEMRTEDIGVELAELVAGARIEAAKLHEVAVSLSWP